MTKQGCVFNRLTAVAFSHKNTRWQNYWKYRCSCGNVVVLAEYSVKSGHTKSCGCLNQELRAERKTTHGKSDTKLYLTWKTMRQRCNDPNCASYAKYGGKGVAVCAEWDSFDIFVRDMGDKPTIRHTLDRIDPEGDYTPENCRWVLPEMQAINKRGGCPGVELLPSGKYRVRQTTRGLRTLIGVFDTKEAAEAAAQAAHTARLAAVLRAS